MHILITGGTGFIGSALCPQLLTDGHQLTVLTRHPEKVARRYEGRIRPIRSLTEFRPEWPLDAVINLAGEGIADRPWSAARKQQLHASRITVTEELVDILRRRDPARSHWRTTGCCSLMNCPSFPVRPWRRCGNPWKPARSRSPARPAAMTSLRVFSSSQP